MTLQYNFEGQALKTKAMERMEKSEWVREARRVALGIARSKGKVCADDVRPLVPEAPHPNLWGSVFTKDLFYMSGEVKATRSVAHARWTHYWSLRRGD